MNTGARRHAALAALVVAVVVMTGAVRPAGASSPRPAVRSVTPPASQVADRFTYPHGDAGIQATATGYRFRSGPQADHLSVLVVGGRLRFADHDATSWSAYDHVSGRRVTQLPDSCEQKNVRRGVAALCTVPGAATVFVETWTGSGNDSVDTTRLPSRFRTWASPGPGTNTLDLGPGADHVSGGRDRDIVRSHGGSDDIHGGGGDDYLVGGVGNDRLYGDVGADVLLGEGGADLLRGGAGVDRIVSGPAADRVGCNDPADAVRADRQDVRRAPTVAVPLHRDGAHILDRNGRLYRPYGVTLTALTRDPTAHALAMDRARMRAIAGAWCGNTVRLQVSLDQMLTWSSYNPLLLSLLGIRQSFSHAVQEQVGYARSLGLVVVVSLQSEIDPDYNRTFMPTTRAIRFWQEIVRIYGDDPGVIFDLYNEPGLRVVGCGVHDFNCDWRHWHNGFEYDGVDYLGMQDLATQVRAMGAKNVFWIEGPHPGRGLRYVSRYPIRGVGDFAYAIHHPPLPTTATSWHRNFGYLVERHIAPVVVGEWANYADAPPGNDACWWDAPQSVPRFFHYLSAHGIGLIAWKLDAGFLTSGSDFSRPGTLGSRWRCTGALATGGRRTGKNAGGLLMRWFQAQNLPTGG